MGQSKHWTPAQSEIIDFPTMSEMPREGGLLITAGAGTGKTTTLIEMCLGIVAHKPDAQLCVVSFTERSAQDLRLKFGQAGLQLSDHWVTTLHGMCRSVVREFPETVGLAGDESVIDEPGAKRLWRETVERLWFDRLPESLDQAVRLLLLRESATVLEALFERGRRGRTLGHLSTVHSPRQSEAEALVAVVDWLNAQYQEAKKVRGVLDFDDLEHCADLALESTTVQSHYHRKFDWVIIDEFQDTNPLQSKIVARMAKPGGTNRVVVGDPKQSIYRFRDADVSLFVDYEHSKVRKVSLRTNFRSRPPLLEWINRACAPIFAPLSSDSQITYEALDPGRALECTEDASTPVRSLAAPTPEAFAVWVQQESLKDPKWLDETVLLLRKVRGNQHWIRALKAAGVSLSMTGGGMLWEDPDIREMVSGIRALLDPTENLSAAIFMRSPWIGVSDVLIDEWRTHSTSATLMECFMNSPHPVASAWQDLWARREWVRPGEWLLRLADLGMFPGSKVMWLWNKLEDLSYRGDDQTAILGELTRCLDERPRTLEPTPPGAMGSLRVMTIHGSKGLEFERVLLVDFGEPSRSAAAPLLFWDRKRGAYFAGRDESHERMSEDATEGDWRAIEKSEALDESRRLFYVAVTRAKQELVLVLPERRAKMPAPSERARYDDWRAWVEGILPTVEVLEQRERTEPPVVPSEIAESELPSRVHPTRLIRPRHSASEWRILDECERKYGFLIAREPIEAEAEAETRDRSSGFSSGPAPQQAAALGTAIHQMIERQSATLADEIAEKIKATPGTHSQLDPHRILKWTSESEWWDSKQTDDVWNELFFEFTLPISRHVLVGGIDRLVRRGEKYFVLDYKIVQRQRPAEYYWKSYHAPMTMYDGAVQSLEPRARGNIEQVLLVFSPEETVEHRRSIADPFEILEHWGSRAQQVIEQVARGEIPAARPGWHCRSCDWLERCPAGKQEGLLKKSVRDLDPSMFAPIS